jgi:hypothetical protein
VLDLAVLAAGVASQGRGQRRRGFLTAAGLSVIGGLDLYTALRTTGNGSV